MGVAGVNVSEAVTALLADRGIDYHPARQIGIAACARRQPESRLWDPSDRRLVLGCPTRVGVLTTSRRSDDLGRHVG